jgi:hypothetical protein
VTSSSSSSQGVVPRNTRSRGVPRLPTPTTLSRSHHASSALQRAISPPPARRTPERGSIPTEDPVNYVGTHHISPGTVNCGQRLVRYIIIFLRNAFTFPFSFSASVADAHKVMGIAQQEDEEAGPDEDDFHTFRRRNAEIEKADKKAVKETKKLQPEHVPRKPPTARPTKVVYF